MKVKNLLTVTAFILGGVVSPLCAQGIDMVSYTPLKKGNFIYMSVHSRANLATGEGSVVDAGTLYSNGSTLRLNTSSLSFASPVNVRNNAFIRPALSGTPVFTASNLLIGGKVYDYTQSVTASLSSASTYIDLAGRNLNFPTRDLKLSATQSIYVGGILLEAPPTACTSNGVNWVTVQAATTYGGAKSSYKILACN